MPKRRQLIAVMFHSVSYTHLRHDSVAQMNARCKGELPEPKTAFEPLRRIILKACAFEPKDRYQSAADMRADLENAKSIGNKEKEIRKYV